MTFGNVGNNQFLIRLERGEETVESIKQFCTEHSVKNATCAGVGSIEDPTLAHYKVNTKKYSEKKLSGVFEVTSLLGNVGQFENKPLVHAHITLGDEEMHAFAGHLVNGLVSATMEIVLTVLPTAFEKKYSEAIGLKLYEFPPEA